MKNLPMLIFALVIFLFSVNFSYSADYWAKTYGGHFLDYAESVQQTFDGGYIVTGLTQSFGSGSDHFWLLKLDESGNILWQKAYARSFSLYPWIIQQTMDGGYIVAGYTGTGDYYVNGDVLILKIDEYGDIDWQNTYGGNNDDSVSSIQQTADGGYIVVGFTYSFGAGIDDAWVLKLDEDGAITWQKTFGGEDYDTAESIQQTSDGGYIVGGFTRSFDAGNGDAWVLKLDANGDVSWQKAYGSSDATEVTRVIQESSDSGYIVAGEEVSDRVGIWLFKLDENGNVSWQKNYDERFMYYAHNRAPMQQTSDKGYILTGFTKNSSDIWLLKLNEFGDFSWKKTYGGSNWDFGYSIQQTADNDYILAGWTNSFGVDEWGITKGNMILLKLNSHGEIPGCNINEASNIAPFKRNITVQDTSAIITSTTASITKTYISPFNTSAEITIICESASDTDNDGIPDDQDNCPVSNLEEIITIDGCVAEYGCNKTVANQLLDGGCTMSDLIVECIDSSSNHGEFVNCVNHLTNDWRNNGFIDEKEKEAIQSCAAEANIP